MQICAYCNDAAFPEVDGKYQQVVQSFHFDPGFAYDNSEAYVPLIAGSVVGLGVVIAAVVAVFLAVRTSRKKPEVIPYAGYGGYPPSPVPPQGWNYPTAPPPPPAGQWPLR